jgi:hypothetical protein
MVGLSNVDNTSDANKPVSQLRKPLDLKKHLANLYRNRFGIDKTMVGFRM